MESSLTSSIYGRPEFFYFFGLFFFTVIHKYVSGGMILKSGPLARRHRRWRRGLGLDADVTVTWQAARRRRSDAIHPGAELGARIYDAEVVF